MNDEKTLNEAAEAARKRVSGYSAEERYALREKGRRIMNDETKAGKKCRKCKGEGGYHAGVPEGAWLSCDDCHGLRWLPQPGDALTWREASILANHRDDVQECLTEWISFRKGRKYSDSTEVLRFRLAPDPKHAEELSTSEANAAHWMGQAHSIDQERNSLEIAIKAQRDKHAEEVAAKDAEIERLKGDLQFIRDEKRQWSTDMAEANFERNVAQLELADAREREEMEHQRAEFHLRSRNPRVPEGGFILFRDGDAWCCVDVTFIDLQNSRAGFGETMDEALAAYDASRAADKEGA